MIGSAAPDEGQDRLEQAGQWCMRLAEGALSGGEQQAFDVWIAADPRNLSALENAVKVWHRFGEASTAPEFIPIRERALAAYRRRNRARWAHDAGALRRLMAIAACFLALLIGGAYWWANQPIVYRTAVGERRIVMLDDGSRLSLDAATAVEVRLRGDRRDLKLVAGRAKFDVAKNPLKPFSVMAGDKMVVATGTSFSVELVRRRMHVILYEGQVAVLDRGPDGVEPEPLRLAAAKSIPAERLLKPGRELISDLSRPTASVVAADLSRSLAWESGQLTFIDEPLASAVERVNRYSARKVELADPAAAAMQVNGVFNAGDVEAFVVGVREILPVRIRDRSGNILIASAQ
ncbi:FecR family protein [Sphingosinicella rhizophila]|uniref:FecR domain-containing protein n=1 Tax=Sphingosinicella rhizophila TaxID=3050082 RepID=A0ABU3QC63_9SPHN|nr:FecR domain-containing protein [Sphingosinicella sp. GR2756]MDT9600989.1 FecR domain-containing protein [Sphingosinicella sp. GR2756]